MNEKSCAKTRIGLWGMPVSKHYVNLDALIIREYLHKKPEGVVDPSSKIKGIKISDLVDASFLYQSLRKPDFQRETSNWEPEKIVDLVESFLKGDFVPSIILWYSQDGKTFVIDGAHRLSALIAWVHDDYGDKEISINFFSNLISPEQKKIADKTRNLMAVRVGSYLDIQKALSFQANSSDKHKLFARNAGVLDFQIQWVGGSDPDIAENSFKKINQKATLIDPTEFQMIESRRKPNAIATRALIRAGVGHKYWGGLPDDAQLEIQKISKQVYDMLFIPPLEDRITTLELPVAGKGYSAESVRLIFDFVNLANDLVVNQRKLKEVNDDIDGAATIECLKKVSKIISRICSKDNRSLGLHPAVYFYSAAGRYQPTAFLAIVSLIMEFEKSDEFLWFTQHRSKFEEFLLNHRYFVNQIVSQFGSGFKGYNWIFKLYKEILRMVADGTESNIAKILVANNQWRLKEVAKNPTGEFSTETKTAIIIRDSLAAALRCSICGARMHKNSMNIDHKTRRQDGGSGDADNGQITHFFCNSGYKESQHAKALTTSVISQ